ncbi:uncharacterized protein V1510DRAFT_421656 [Dipodascopsis tothii]|uniref:uncharacterized protein n=1 Tax=Dipodascopsis tothii TaxID=44089 RepID=UPI0034D02267
MSSQDRMNTASQPPVADDDEPDEWDKRIEKTGCAEENMRLTDCYAVKRDWRICADEVRKDITE